jgi:RNA polymerase sigma-70 factor (ECF subfamily)
LRAPTEKADANAAASDERLLIEAAQQDPRRFAELYERNFERVYAYIAHRVRDRDVAEDLTAEVFHQALATLRRFEWRGVPFAAWLIGIAAHLIASRWRNSPFRREPPFRAADLDSDETAEGNGNGHYAMHVGARDLAEVEQRALIAQLVAALPEDQQRVITRRFLEHRSIREIAQEMGRTEGAVKQLQFRALENLRARIRSHRNV